MCVLCVCCVVFVCVSRVWRGLTPGAAAAAPRPVTHAAPCSAISFAVHPFKARARNHRTALKTARLLWPTRPMTGVGDLGRKSHFPVSRTQDCPSFFSIVFFATSLFLVTRSGRCTSVVVKGTLLRPASDAEGPCRRRRQREKRKQKLLARRASNFVTFFFSASLLFSFLLLSSSLLLQLLLRYSLSLYTLMSLLHTS